MRVLGGRDQAVRVAACLASAIVAGGFILGSVSNSAGAADSAPTLTTTTAAPTVTSVAPVASTTTTTVTATTTTTVNATTTVAPVAPTTTTPVANVETEPVVAPTTEPVFIEPTVESTAVTTPETTPEMTVVTTVAAPTNQSSCRSDLPGAVMTITMADIDYECAVYPGGQSVIDAGVATVITANESPFALASSPGDAGTLWITGHRESHGGPFAAVPDLADGAIISVSDGTVVASYVIVGRAYVEVRDGLAVDASGTATESATLDAVLRTDRNAESAARLLLQTCDSEDFRWMIYADLITG